MTGVCKIAIEREQSQACLGYAEREQFGRSQRRESATLTARPRLPDAISFSCQLFHGFKNPRLFALRASRLPDAFER